MKFLLFLSLLFTAFSYSQLNKVVARKSCNVDESCPAHSYGSGLKWSGITIYDWWDHDGKSSTLDILGWSSCVKATVTNSGSASVITEDHCTCRTNFTKNHLPNCVGRRSCACICVPQSCTRTRSCRMGTGTERGTGTRDCISGNCNVTSWDTSQCRICTEQSCTRTRSCRVGIGIERGTGTTVCPSGNCNITSWDTSQCTFTPPPCTPQSCTPQKRCPGSSTWMYGDSHSGRRKCDSSGNLSSVCTGGTYSNSCPSCTSNSDCERCEECSGGQCVGKTTGWRPTYNINGPCTQSQERCVNGRSDTRSHRDDRNTNCEQGPCPLCQERGRNNMCVPKARGSQPAGCTGCRECNGRGQCVSKSNCCTSDSQCGGCQRCSGGRCVAKANCCTSDSQCGTCKRCSGGQCVNRARHSQPPGCSGCKECRSGACQNKPPTAWQPSLGGSCGTVTQTRCYGGVLRERDKPGTRRCRTCQQCNSSGQCVNKRDSWEAWKPPWTSSQHCPNESQLQKRKGCIGGVEKKYPDRGSYRTLRGSKRPQDCCNLQSCTPANKTCPGGSIQSPTGSGQYRCKNGRVDTSKCVYTGGWAPAECPDCTPRSASDCPSSHPHYSSWLKTCNKCRIGMGYYVPPDGRGQGRCCVYNPDLGDNPCRRIVETWKHVNVSIRNICQ